MKEQTKLPENAFRPLEKGEEYEPVMSPQRQYRELTPWSIAWGLVMAVIFSAACAYLGLKVGQVFEAAIPITIIAIGLSGAAHRKDPLGENVIIQSIGACSGMIVAGAIFTLPALFILQSTNAEIQINFLHVFLASLLGGVLGILFLIPFRKYFVKEKHGEYPFPEATASTQVLISGESGAGQAKPLLVAGLIGGLYDFIVASTGAWAETFSTTAFAWGKAFAAKTKLMFSLNTSAALLGMGYIVGLKYAAIICAGSVTVWWVIVPVIGHLFPDVVVLTDKGTDVLAGTAMPAQIFQYAKSIGIGGIAMAGIIGVIKSWSVIRGSFGLIGKMGKGTGEGEELRTQRDLPMKIILWGTLLTIVVTTVFFFFGPMEGNLLHTIVGILIVAVVAFLFTTVAANAIAIVGSNPVSGMTLMTLILSSIILVLVGLNGTHGMVAALIMGGVVCTALSTAGSFVTDLKIGYWLGSTPAKQESLKFLGVLVSAATVCGVIYILNNTYGFTETNEEVMAAPQARAMAAVIKPLMSGEGAPWLLYGIGALLAVVLDRCKVSALAFSLGMFIPLHLNLPLIVGGLVSHLVTHSSGSAPLNRARGERGTLLASGFIAGGALMGVVSAGLTFFGADMLIPGWAAHPKALPLYPEAVPADPASVALSLAAYALIIIYLVRASMVKRIDHQKK
ncbi:MAG: oligopeptide transporter, OPT family [Alloprevotella sp.]|nr:oligopeptide transporter, OPT family [Alloprevotella sp.]